MLPLEGMAKKPPSVQVNVRVSAAEKARLEGEARRRGFRSAAEYLRSLARRPYRTYTVLIHRGDADEGGYWAEVPALPGCVTQGDTLDELMTNAHDAIHVYLAMCARHGDPIPTEALPKGKTTRALVHVESPV